MNRRGVRRDLLLLAAILSLAVGAGAQWRRAGLEALGGMVYPAGSPLERGLGTGFGFTWPMARNTRVGVHFLYASLTSKGEDQGFLPGKVTVTPFLVFLRQDIALSKRLSLQFIGGGGIVFARVREDVITIPEVTISQHLPNSAAFHLGARASFSLSASLAVFVQGGYLLCSTTGTTTVRDMNLGVSGQEFKADLSSLQAVLGMAYYF